MEITFTKHALYKLGYRKIPKNAVIDTINDPEKKTYLNYNRILYQSTYRNSHLEKEMILRVIGEENVGKIVVITAYKTSKFHKYR